MDLLDGRQPRLLGDPLTEIRAATVDVYCLRRVDSAWHVLLLERGPNTRCTGAWEVVHGRREPDERAEEAAVREVREETGLDVDRLYTTAVQPFYLPSIGTITLAVVFAAVVAGGDVRLGAEHSRHRWCSIEEALTLLAWPRSRVALEEIVSLLATGDAGPVEDVLRVR